MDGLILFRRPRKILKSKLSENDNYVYKSGKKTKISVTKKNRFSNNHLPISQSNLFSSIGTRLNFMNKTKNKRQGDVTNLVNNSFGCLFIKGGMANETSSGKGKASNTHNDNEYQYPIEICNNFQISNHTQITHDYKQLKSTITRGSFSANNFNDILQVIPKPIKRTPLYHGLLLIARELRTILTKTIDTDIKCSIEKVPRNFQQSLDKYQVNYVIVLKEKMNYNQLIWYNSSEDNTMKLIRFQENLKSNEFCQRGHSVTLEACQLKYLPDLSLPDLSAFYVTLRFLNLSRNYLEQQDVRSLGDKFCVTKLRVRKIKALILVDHELACQLKSLNLSYCLIEHLTYEFYDLKSLEQLDLSYNCLTYLDSRIKNLEHIKVLKLNGNDLTGIPPGLLCLCEKALESLNLNDNPLLCLFPKEFKNNSSIEIQSLTVLASLKMRDLLNETNKQNEESSREKPGQYILITNLEENNANFLEFRKVSDKEECTMFNKLLNPSGSCCWCGMDRYDQKNTICMHCVDLFNYSAVPICMLCCGIQCAKEVKQCSTSEQFAKRYYKSYQNYTNR
ncbi:putative leucine-rich repeat-containing protein [Schistosoma mansoni]|uniref:putative leucine-rich repeat-containing protein n=1 Tax=Schistosoma mansoni TaxID=6183 RepID=UPI00022DC49D|nr:putative leucine-rich repeat-containing protein [Schistosoma mansoni]|eukprot:XP_018650231.1 putative leucine-rich repeat-containing protein [Schistosoma mansoni]